MADWISVRLDKQRGQQWTRHGDVQEIDIGKNHPLRMRHVRHQHVAWLPHAASLAIAADQATLPEEVQHIVVDAVAGDAEAGSVEGLGGVIRISPRTILSRTMLSTRAWKCPPSLPASRGSQIGSKCSRQLSNALPRVRRDESKTERGIGAPTSARSISVVDSDISSSWLLHRSLPAEPVLRPG